MKQNEIKESSSRIVNLDFLRGIFIILAANQHFAYYINMWYVDYFRDAIALVSTYKVHLPMIGQQVPIDYVNYLIAIIFTPWLSQMYLAMAAFNLAKRTPEAFAEVLPAKLRLFGLIYIFFVMENLIVAPNFGQGISIYPIMLWMILLGTISILYRHFGIGGIIGLSIIACLRFVIPMEFISGFFQDFMIQNIHPGFEYDARLEYFIHSACLGFIMGYVHYHRRSIAYKKDLYFVFVGAILVGVYALFGDAFTIDRSDILNTEHDLARTFTGTAYILGVQTIVLSTFLWLERANIKIKLPLIDWVGKNSLYVFSLHRILFVRMIAPFSIFLGSMFGYTLGASVPEVYLYIGLTLLICYLIKYTKLPEIILQQKG